MNLGNISSNIGGNIGGNVNFGNNWISDIITDLLKVANGGMSNIFSKVPKESKSLTDGLGVSKVPYVFQPGKNSDRVTNEEYLAPLISDTTKRNRIREKNPGMSIETSENFRKMNIESPKDAWNNIKGTWEDFKGGFQNITSMSDIKPVSVPSVNVVVTLAESLINLGLSVSSVVNENK
jgi:hypothetical protein